ncbi:peptidylprolyl isomerase [Vulcanococcus limneticus Candia 3F8]|uniref:peptidylprolyl isomerase n=1 Tax=Vulcanococcus limneticus TaxID=2170428 RepID=UPI0012FFA04E|nr:peptidylprolyl isomerase [Vulcanococcus limneticus]MCP9792841.1 peptidylprolyl isomerase [Vulcanococcus limneticus MW73D5]MCP9894831.1 peptidylprolyl isomerase [Vulcanococcus limneticus Candia 3F8]MCP9898310.1 peptidylprolyl isomerase [Vulcanococcus limneticus Candia 3B3]
MSDLTSTFPPAALERLRRRNLLRNLLEQEIVAEAVRDIAIPEEEQDQAIAKFSGKADPEAMASQMACTHGWSRDDLTWQALLPLRIERFCQQQYASKSEARFLQRKIQLDQVVYSLLRVQDGALARELYFQIASGEASFGALAAQYSEGPERASSGVIGPKPLTSAHPQLAERLRTAKDGELLDPFPLASWWVVARLDRYIHATFDEGTAKQMAFELFSEWVKEEATIRIAHLLQPTGASLVSGLPNG